MPRTLKEPPEWYNDEETLKKLLAIVIAALCCDRPLSLVITPGMIGSSNSLQAPSSGDSRSLFYSARRAPRMSCRNCGSINPAARGFRALHVVSGNAALVRFLNGCYSKIRKSALSLL